MRRFRGGESVAVPPAPPSYAGGARGERQAAVMNREVAAPWLTPRLEAFRGEAGADGIQPTPSVPENGLDEEAGQLATEEALALASSAVASGITAYGMTAPPAETGWSPGIASVGNDEVGVVPDPLATAGVPGEQGGGWPFAEMPPVTGEGGSRYQPLEAWWVERMPGRGPSVPRPEGWPFDQGLLHRWTAAMGHPPGFQDTQFEEAVSPFGTLPLGKIARGKAGMHGSALDGRAGANAVAVEGASLLPGGLQAPGAGTGPQPAAGAAATAVMTLGSAEGPAPLSGEEPPAPAQQGQEALAPSPALPTAGMSSMEVQLDHPGAGANEVGADGVETRSLPAQGVEEKDGGSGRTRAVSSTGARPEVVETGSGQGVDELSHQTAAGDRREGEPVSGSGSLRSDEGGSSYVALDRGPGQAAEARSSEGARPPLLATARTPEQVSKDIIRVAQQLREGGSQEMTLHLKPEHLGRLLVRVSVENGEVQVRILAEQPEAKALLSSQLPELRQALEEDGFRLEHARVDGWSGDGSADTDFHGAPYGNHDHPDPWSPADRHRGGAVQVHRVVHSTVPEANMLFAPGPYAVDIRA